MFFFQFYNIPWGKSTSMRFFCKLTLWRQPTLFCEMDVITIMLRSLYVRWYHLRNIKILEDSGKIINNLPKTCKELENMSVIIIRLLQRIIRYGKSDIGRVAIISLWKGGRWGSKPLVPTRFCWSSGHALSSALKRKPFQLSRRSHTVKFNW